MAVVVLMTSILQPDRVFLEPENLPVQLLDVLRAFRRRGFVALGDMSQQQKYLATN